MILKELRLTEFCLEDFGNEGRTALQTIDSLSAFIEAKRLTKRLTKRLN